MSKESRVILLRGVFQIAEKLLLSSLLTLNFKLNVIIVKNRADGEFHFQRFKDALLKI